MGLRKTKNITHAGKRVKEILEAHERFFSGKEGGARADLAGAQQPEPAPPARPAQPAVTAKDTNDRTDPDDNSRI